MPQQERILCAAIRLADNNPRQLKTTYSDLSICEIGYRHCDIFERFGKLVSHKVHDQGFFTSSGRFVERREAMKIAYLAGQVSFVTAVKDINGAKIMTVYDGEDIYRERPRLEIKGEPIWNQLYSEDLY